MKKGRIIFNTLSIIFISSLFIIYGYRLIHYYRLEHKVYDTSETKIIDVLLNNKGIEGTDDGLQKSESGYIYGSKSKNNYFYYLGRMWRIVSIDENNNIKLITDEIQTMLGVNDSNYEKSDVSNWLNVTDVANSGIFVKSLKDKVSNVALLDKKDYELLDEHNYLANELPYLIIDNGNLLYVDNKGIHDDVNGFYGIRPVITVSGDNQYLAGVGNFDSPYTITGESPSTVDDLYVGEYVKYSGYVWRVISNGTVTKMVMDNVIEVPISFSSNNQYSVKVGLGEYLNNAFINEFENADYLVPVSFNIGNYIPTAHNYLDTYSNSVDAKVGMLSIGDFYINEYENIYTGTIYGRTKNTIYVINSNRKLYADLYTAKYRVRPVIGIDSSLKIVSGKGTKEFAYEIGR